MIRSRLRSCWQLAAFVAVLAGPTAARAQQKRAPAGVLGGDTITYFVAEGDAASGFHEGDRTLAVWAVEAWLGQLESKPVIVAAPESEAILRVYWAAAGAGLYGETRQRVVRGRPAADVFVQPDTDALGRDIALAARADPLFRDTIVYLTCVHEIGHALGLGHTEHFADIMYSFVYGGDLVAYFMRFREQLRTRDDVRTASPFSAGDVDALRAVAR